MLNTKKKKVLKWFTEDKDIGSPTFYNKQLGIEGEIPDLVYNKYKDKTLIVEIDEHQHKGSNYTKLKKTEIQRMINIQLYFKKKTVFLRYNPDNFRKNNILISVSDEERRKKLINIFKIFKNLDYKFLSNLFVLYLYYDNHDDSKFEFFDIDVRTGKQIRKEIFINDKKETFVKVIVNNETKEENESDDQDETNSNENISNEEYDRNENEEIDSNKDNDQQEIIQFKQISSKL